MLHVPALSVAAAQRGAPASVVLADNGRIVFRVAVPAPSFAASKALTGTERIRIDGFDLRGEPGEPAIPAKRFLVALPPDGTYSVSAKIIASQSFGSHRLEPVPRLRAVHDEEIGPLPGEEFVWDEPVYRARTAPGIAVPEDAAYIRHQRVLPVWINPVIYDLQNYDLSVATTVEVEVRLDRPRESMTTSPPARPDAPQWTEAFGRLFVNPQQTRDWRVPATEMVAPTSMMRSTAPGAVKLNVRETGIHRVAASAVIAAGFPAGQPVNGLRLFKRGYNETTLSPTTQDIAFTVLEGAGGVSGTFDGNDLLVFYGRRLRDDASQGDVREQFSFFNVYWLEPGAGTPMAQRSPGVGVVSADTATASFPTSVHAENDLWFFDAVPFGTQDVYYANSGFEAGPVDMTVPLGTAKPGTNVQLSAEVLGQSYESPRTIKVALVNSGGEQVLDPAYSVPLKSRRVFTASVPASQTNAGDNVFRIDRPDNSRTVVKVLLNWAEASYSALYRARGNALRFNSATLAGDTSLTVTGLSTTSNLELFDITNPIAPVRVLVSPGHFQPVPGGFALSFRETIPSRREFQLVPVSRMIAIAPADIEADVPSSIIGGVGETGIDVLVVSHADFIPQMRQWASYRRAQGYRVLVVDVEDVYDEFSGGVTSATAIYRFARHFFEHGDASALVLVGDSSEDNKLVHEDSGPNFVPTFSRIDAVPVLQLDEVVTTDKRFVKFPGPGGTIDAFPDMIVGRLPVGSVGELEILLNKVYAYERPTASDFWRKRMIIVADDEYSEGNSGFGGFPFCDNNEVGFASSQETTALTIGSSLPAGYDVVRFYLADYTSSFYTTQCANRFAAITFVRENVTDLLIGELSAGATLVTIQSHMNRSTVTHERLLSTQPAQILGGSTGRDHFRVDNRDKPFILFGMGCHFSEYAIHREHFETRTIENSPNGDAFAEQFLFQGERGAVGTYGSSGFEYLFPNNRYMETTARVWFYEAPYDTMLNQTQAEWKFGELMFLVESQMAGEQRDPVERYHILGDPLLRIDAGPPNFDVTVNGRPFETGEVVEAGGVNSSVDVVAVVTDENAIRKFSLEIDGVDATDSLRITPLTDANLPRARQYQVSFSHRVRPDNYDIVLRAFQSPDTLAGKYHIAAEFVMRVESSISVSVNGRAVASGASVPGEGQYRIDLSFPVFVPSSEIGVYFDENAVTNLAIVHPSPADSLAWMVTFRQTLAPGTHTMRVAASTLEFNYRLVVSDDPGLRSVINYPNPFRGAGTSFIYSNDSEIVDGTIDIFTVTGKRIRRVDIPPAGRIPGQNSVFWDGRDGAGDAIANGTYLYVIRVNQRGGSATVRGKVSKLQ